MKSIHTMIIIHLGSVLFSVLIANSFFFDVPLALAAPSVSKVSSTLSDGNTVTITGSSFGSGPHVHLFDDFESGTVGQSIKTGAGSAKHGQWSKSTNLTKYSSTAKLSGSKSFQTNISPTLSGGTALTTRFAPESEGIFVSAWYHIPAGTRWPGEGHKDNINWKTIWVFGDGLSKGGTNYFTADDDYILPVLNGAADGTQMAWKISGNDKDSQNSGLYVTNEMWMNKGEWRRAWMWIKGSTTGSSADGEVKFSALKSTGVVSRSNSRKNTLETGGYWTSLNVNGYVRKVENSFPTFDDVYIALGPNAQARVEVGNASTYTKSTKLTILTPKSWSNTSITAQVNRGNLPSGSAYLYVFDKNGVPNATGFPVTLGTSGGTTTPDPTPPPVPDPTPGEDTTPPAVPTGLRVQ